jgi:hypothetical protein
VDCSRLDWVWIELVDDLSSLPKAVNPEREKYLNLHTKPGKVTAEEASWHLGFSAHEIPMLTAAGLLNPLGHPSENGCKFFLSHELDQLKQDRTWFEKACDTIIKYWKDRNQQRPTHRAKKRWPHKYVGTDQNGKAVKPRAVRPKSPKIP